MILNLLSIFKVGDKISTESLLKNILESAVLRDAGGGGGLVAKLCLTLVTPCPRQGSLSQVV